MSTTPRTYRRRLSSAAISTLTLGAIAFGGLAAATPASAAPTCSAGYVCFWTKSDGGGEKKSYSSAANHSHKTASVYYNYNYDDISFWTGPSGTGDIITHYKLSERGFRNWSSSNWDRCRSHRNYY
ncbi:hypothetical protein [Cellulomonas sp. FA1]|jgi:hypothetical protein|uniref:hypothetical protein n=1 Tax=Cellulomonas sp. FA1 TaxID=1346710 RepID=UPI000625F4AC|nr:hypothetical protein [Cellulomonas sp. FA1]